MEVPGDGDLQRDYVSGERVSCYGAADSVAGEQRCAWNSDGGDYDERGYFGICDEYGSGFGTERRGVRDGPANGRHLITTRWRTTR